MVEVTIRAAHERRVMIPFFFYTRANVQWNESGLFKVVRLDVVYNMTAQLWCLRNVSCILNKYIICPIYYLYTVLIIHSRPKSCPGEMCKLTIFWTHKCSTVNIVSQLLLSLTHHQLVNTSWVNHTQGFYLHYQNNPRCSCLFSAQLMYSHVTVRAALQSFLSAEWSQQLSWVWAQVMLSQCPALSRLNTSPSPH